MRIELNGFLDLYQAILQQLQDLQTGFIVGVVLLVIVVVMGLFREIRDA